MVESTRRQWIAGAGAMVLACERTKAPSGERAAGEPVTAAKHGAPLRIGQLDASLGAPLQIVPSRDGGSALVVLRGGFVIADDALRAFPSGAIVDRRAVTTDTGWCVGALHVDANGAAGDTLRGAGSLDETGARQLALRVAAEDWVTAVAVQGNERPQAVVVTRRGPQGGPRWSFEQPGRAAAAIDDDGRVALATEGGQLRVLADRHDGAEAPNIVLDLVSIPPAYAITFDRAGIVLLVAPRVDVQRDAGDRIAAPVDWRPGGTWSTEVVELGSDGTSRARTRVELAALQPPLRFADGEIAVVGMGAARIRDGAVTWSRVTDTRVHACVAGDELLLGGLASIERIGPRGEVRSRDALGDAPVACPPAVGPDGRVWIATTTAVWRIG